MINKTKIKTKRNDNPDVHYANCYVKNVRKVLVKHFDSNHTIMVSCDDKCIVKIGALGCPLALFSQDKRKMGSRGSRIYCSRS